MPVPSRQASRRTSAPIGPCARSAGKLPALARMAALDPDVLATLYDESPEPVFVLAPRWRDHPEEKIGQSLRTTAPDSERSGMLARYVRTMESAEPTDALIHYDDGRIGGWFRIHA